MSVTHFKYDRPVELQRLMGPTYPCQWCGWHLASGNDEGLCAECHKDCAAIYRPPVDNRPVFVFDNGDNNPDPYFTCRIHGEEVNK